MNKNKNILIWGGINYVDLFLKPMINFFSNSGYALKLVCNSRETKNATSLHKYEEGLFLRSTSLKKIITEIEEENPKALLISNYKSLSNALILKIASHLNKTTIFIQHGLFDAEINTMKSTNYFNSFKKYFYYIFLYLQFSLFGYSLISIIKEIYDIINASYKEVYKKVNYALCFSENDKLFLSKNLGITRDNISVTGYPIFKDEISQKKFENNSDNNSKIVLVLLQTFVQNSNYTYSDEINQLIEINKICERNGYKLFVKLHPLENIENYNSLNEYINIRIFDKSEDTFNLIKTSKVIVGYNSTSLLLAIHLNKPILLIPFYDMEIDYLMFNEVGTIIKDIHELERYFVNDQSNRDFQSEYRSFKKKYLSDNLNYEYTAKTIIKLVSG